MSIMEWTETLYQSFSPFLAEAVGFEPTDPSLDHSISSRGRYDHFETLPHFMPLIEIAYSYIIWIVSRMSIGKSKNLDLFFDFLDCRGRISKYLDCKSELSKYLDRDMEGTSEMETASGSPYISACAAMGWVRWRPNPAYRTASIRVDKWVERAKRACI